MRSEHTSNPVLVEITRGDSCESRHRGAACVANGEATIAAWGDVDAVVFPRSAVKPLQALPLIATGAAARFRLSPPELAIACGSHGGEARHVRTVAGWLARLGYGPGALVCGPHPPLNEAAAEDLVRRGEAPGRLHNNCSGKHAGFLSVARALGVSAADYDAPEHPVQRRVAATLAALAGLDARALRYGIDGCGVPAFALPLATLARAFARFAAADDNDEEAKGAPVIRAAMLSHPEFVAGTGRFDTEIIAAAAGAVLVKGGAEGVVVAALPPQGLAIAVKIDDGAKRAAEAAMAALLLRYARVGEAAAGLLRRYADAPLPNSQGRIVGAIRPIPGWP
ncbi:MAG: asparaginase [Rhodospirillales bacterium]